MAAIAAVVSAILRSAWRNLRSVGSFTGNNFFAVIVLLMAEEPANQPSSTAIFYLFIGLLYAIPLAQELTQRIPPERFRLWPLSRIQKASIYAVNLLINPLLPIAILFALLSRLPVVGFALLASGLLAPFVAMGLSTIRVSPIRAIPRFPGRLGGLIQNHLRELVQMLDVYLAVVLSAGGVAYRVFDPHPEPEAKVVLGLLIVILMSTLAQSDLGYDAEATETRLHLLPLSGFQVLLAKDAAWLVITLVITLPYPFLPCLAGALMALAVGHQTVISETIEQRRGYFAKGRLAPAGVVQLMAIAATGAGVSQLGLGLLLAALAVYGGSVWWYGRAWDQRAVSSS